MGTVDLQLTESEKQHIAGGTSHIYRETPHGRAGDAFIVDGKQFEIVDVCERSLNTVARKYSVFGGYDTLAEFVVAWEARQASRCDPGMSFFIHWFRQV